LFNREEVFSAVAMNGLSAVATGNFHYPMDLASWKTVVQCERDEQAVVDFLRSEQRALVVPRTAERRDSIAEAA
jgi:hypothetical protein